jgi:hypothetical protein
MTSSRQKSPRQRHHHNNNDDHGELTVLSKFKRGSDSSPNVFGGNRSPLTFGPSSLACQPIKRGPYS